MERLLYPVSEVAKMLYVNKNRVYKLIEDGELGYVELGTIKIPATELKKYIEKNTNTKTKKIQNNS